MNICFYGGICFYPYLFLFLLFLFLFCFLYHVLPIRLFFIWANFDSDYLSLNILKCLHLLHNLPDFLESVQCSWPSGAPGALVPGKGKISEADPFCVMQMRPGRWDSPTCPICRPRAHRNVRRSPDLPPRPFPCPEPKRRGHMPARNTARIPENLASPPLHSPATCDKVKTTHFLQKGSDHHEKCRRPAPCTPRHRS